MDSKDCRKKLYYATMVISVVLHIVFWARVGSGGYMKDNKYVDIDGESPGRIPELDKTCGEDGQYMCQEITSQLTWALVLSVLAGGFLVTNFVGWVYNAISGTGEPDADGCSTEKCGNNVLYIYSHWIGVILLIIAAILTTTAGDSLSDWSRNVCVQEMPKTTPTGDDVPTLCTEVVDKEDHYGTIFKIDAVSMFEVDNLGSKNAKVINDFSDLIAIIWSAWATAALGLVHFSCT